uniref:Uncharacterized protein n=2 Tax=Oryza TaxID=4527 RepID=A0A0D3GSS2_9ORYZ
MREDVSSPLNIGLTDPEWMCTSMILRFLLFCSVLDLLLQGKNRIGESAGETAPTRALLRFGPKRLSGHRSAAACGPSGHTARPRPSTRVLKTSHGLWPVEVAN